MAVNIDNIPPNAVEVLFAEDLINHIMYRLNGTPYEAWRIGHFRNVIFNAFTDEIKLAVDFIDMALEWESDEEFSKLVDNFQVNEKSFIDYALHYQQLYFHKGFSADDFLHYCVRLGNMSTYFAQHNVPAAPDIAFHFIVQALEGRDMFAGGWNTLNVVAKKYIKLKGDVMNIPSPEVSDDESFADSSEEESDQSLDNREYFEPNLQVPEQELDDMERGNINPEVTWKLSTSEKQASSNEMLDVSGTPMVDSSANSILRGILEKQTSPNEMFDVSETPKVTSDSNYNSNLMTKKLLATNEENLGEIADEESIQD